MLTPEYLNKVPEKIIKLYLSVEQDILNDMASRIMAMDLFIPATQWQYKKLVEMGMLQKDIIKRLSKLTGKRETELKQLIIKSSEFAVDEDLKVYEKNALIADDPFATYPILNDIVKQGIENTNGLFENLTRTTATTASKQFVRALDRAYLKVTTGAFDYNTATTDAIKELCDQGIKSIEYPSGRTDTLEVAVRRAVITGVNQTALKLQDKLADEFECDLVEVSAHEGARQTPQGEPANHAYWQGGIYSRSGTDKKYKSLVEVTGYGTGEGLGGWNCRHSMFPHFEGQKPVYTKQELEDLNKKTIEYNGKKLSVYEASQKQRYFERQIRKWKRQAKALQSVDKPSEKEQAKVKEWENKLNDFVEQTGQKRRYERENVVLGVDKSLKSGIIKEDNKTTITKITDVAIQRVPKVEISGYSNAQNEFIQQQHRELLEFARDKNESKEVAFVFDSNLSNRKEYIGTDDRLDFGNGLYGKDLFVMHNHPRNSSYSFNDIVEFVGNGSVKTITVVKNSGVVETLTKIGDYDAISLLRELDRFKKNNIKMGLDSEFRKIIDKFLIKYREGGIFEWLKE